MESIKFEYLKTAVELIYGVDLEDRTRRQDVVWAKMVVANHLKNKIRISEICVLLDKDNSTVRYYFKKHLEMMQFDKAYRERSADFIIELQKNSNKEKFAELTVRNTVRKLTSELVEMDFSPDQIKDFWNDCMTETTELIHWTDKKY